MRDSDVFKALGPLAPLYSDPEVTDIVVDAPDRVYASRGGKLEQLDLPFDSHYDVREVIDDVLKLAELSLGAQQPTAELRLPDGARFVAVIPPTALDGPCLVIHRPPAGSMSWDKLIEYGALTAEARDLLADAISHGVSVLIAGNLGSGKTTVTSLVAELIPAEQRVIVCEAVAEMRVNHPRVIHFEAGGSSGVSFADLLATASEMRPDWIVPGSLQGADAMAALQLMASGYSGIGTLHATGVEDALARLEAMCLMANVGLGLGQIRALIASAVGLLTYLERRPDGRRVVMDVVELRGVANDRFQLEWLFRFDPDRAALMRTETMPRWSSGPSA